MDYADTDMARRVRRFLALSLSDKRLFCRAWLMLAGYRLAISYLPFRRLARGLTHSPGQRDTESVAEEQVARARDIGRMVAAAGRATPWNSTCLTQVLVIQRLLAARGIPGQFYLGARLRDASVEMEDGLAAHAWLQCGDCIVNGAAGHERFAVLSTFSW